MLEKLYTDSKAIDRYRAGPLGPFVDGFVLHLQDRRYSAATVATYLCGVRHFSMWFTRQKIAPKSLDETLLAAFNKHLVTCRCRYPGGCRNPATKFAAVRFLEFMRAKGHVAQPSEKQVLPLVREFLEYQREHRGCKESTLAHVGRTIIRFITMAGDDPRKYNAYVIREFIRQQARSRGGGLATQQRAASDMRSFVRFLAATGRCKPALEFAVPKIAVWRLSSLPKHIPSRDVARIIAATRDWRDRAIVLLLARLGLRAGDVASMMITALDWQRATVRVCGKSRVDSLLPLPQDVGDAILRYLEHERPGPVEGRLFLTKHAPLTPLSSTSVGSVVRWAIIRAGVVAPNYGSHLLRHSAAVEMLRKGVPLHGVGQVLRHRHLETTEIYAKVDFNRLKTIAQPWPEVGSC